LPVRAFKHSGRLHLGIIIMLIVRPRDTTGDFNLARKQRLQADRVTKYAVINPLKQRIGDRLR